MHKVRTNKSEINADRHRHGILLSALQVMTPQDVVARIGAECVGKGNQRSGWHTRVLHLKGWAFHASQQCL